MDIGRKYLAGLRKKLKSGRSKHWDVSIVFQYIKSISSVVPLPQRAVKQKGMKGARSMFPTNTHTHTLSLRRRNLSQHISGFSVPMWGDIGFQKAGLAKTNESDAILPFPESRPSFFFLFFFFAVSPRAARSSWAWGNKSFCQQGSGFVCPELGCSLLSELSKSPHRFLRWLCACQPTCPSLPVPFSLPSSLQPEASLILRGPAPARWSLSLMSFRSG